MPAQGNIKVKRRSAQLLDNTHDLDHVSDSDEPAARSPEVRNPRKLSQYFPELALASEVAPRAGI